MSHTPPMSLSVFTPFQIRTYRFQFAADLLISCAIEMELPILGWYILVETRSVLLLAVFGGLHYVGTLISPLVGVAGDRLGCRTVLMALRALFSLLSATLLGLVLMQWLDPITALIVSGLGGLFRPSDGMIRNTLVSQTVPQTQLMLALGLSRTTQDMSRVMGALLGTGLVTALGFVQAYLVITTLYCTGTILTRGAHQVILPASSRSPLQDMWQGLVYVRSTPGLLAAFWIACLINLTAYPFTLGLLPHVAKSVYQIDQTGLGYLVASFSLGGFFGSISLSLWGQKVRPAHAMLCGAAVWYIFLLAFGQTESLWPGMILLICAGLAQNICTVPMFVMMLKLSAEDYRGRVMGARILAIYGLPMGLLMASPMIEQWGFARTNLIMTLTGLVLLALIAAIWHRQLVDPQAPANQI